LQAMADVSPPKWHLAHTTWFFETFVLKNAAVSPQASSYHEFHPSFARLFNSYYETAGPFHPRAGRGWLSQPDLATVLRYRCHVDEALSRLLVDRSTAGVGEDKLARIVMIGLHHECQHQELLLADVKYNFSVNPLRPAYQADLKRQRDESGAAALTWQEQPGGLAHIGSTGESFAYDNEMPRHTVQLAPYALASRVITNIEMRAFIDDDGYLRPELWLSDGWRTVREQGWQAPLYWEKQPSGDYLVMTLAGLVPLQADEPVQHVSFFEAQAYATWATSRLPTEVEWEVAAAAQPVTGNFLEGGVLHPQPSASGAAGISQLFGDVWEWTASAYLPYPGYRPWPGALGEYNGKFMCNQLVLRGGSCLSPAEHIRAGYRNFFPPEARWQSTGIRLARDL